MPALEQRAIDFHLRTEPAAVQLWVEGINTFLGGTGALTGQVTRQEQNAQVAITLGALQSCMCALHLAMRGYYPQALNLLRTPVEYWLAYWYLRSYPERHAEFTDDSATTPKWNRMLQAIESKQGTQPDTVVRGWLRQLHPYSHVDTSAVRMMLPTTSSSDFAFGPQELGARFRFCAAQALVVITSWLEALDNFRQLLGRDPLVREAFEKRVEAWVKAGTPTTV